MRQAAADLVRVVVQTWMVCGCVLCRGGVAHGEWCASATGFKASRAAKQQQKAGGGRPEQRSLSRQSRTRDVGAAEARDFPQRPAHAAANVQHLVIVWRAQERVGHTLLQRLPACLHLVLTDRTRRSNPVKPRSGPRRTLCPGCSPSRSARKCSWRLSDSTWPSPAHRCAKWKDSPQPAEG